MTIDIIDLTDPEFSELSPLQLAMVRAAQAKKNTIVAEGEQEKKKLFYMLLANNMGRSSVRTYEEARMDAETQAKVDTVREDLLYQLAYEALGSEGNEFGPYRYPENPNYTLAPAQRFLVVRNYYMGVTSDASARLQAYAMDTLARSYLGEYYQTLYELFASYI